MCTQRQDFGPVRVSPWRAAWVRHTKTVVRGQTLFVYHLICGQIRIPTNHGVGVDFERINSAEVGHSS